MEERMTTSKRKKTIIGFTILVVILIGALIFALHLYFHPKTQNVFEQLYYETRSVKWGQDSVLISGTETAYADYDFGEFDHIAIPELNTSLDIKGDTLYILFSNHEPDEDWRYVLYKYHLKEKRLYGERPVEFLVDRFLSDYFTWYGNAGKSNPYSADDLGEYEFELRETVYYD